MRLNQRGGTSSDYSGLFHAWTADPMSQTRHTLQNIDQAPMFHPLKSGMTFPTGSSGVIPTGTYLAHVGGAKSQPGCHMSLKKRCAGYDGPDADGCVKGPDERCRLSTGLRRAYNVRKPASAKQLAALAKARAARARKALQKGGNFDGASGGARRRASVSDEEFIAQQIALGDLTEPQIIAMKNA